MSRPTGVLRAATFVAWTIVAAFVFSSSALAADNSSCLTCHGTTLSVAVTDVNRDTACEACHIPGLVGSHPYHQPGANCSSACHPSWGDSLATAIPAYSDPSGASFASESSKDTSASVLHIIHSKPRWPAGVSVSFSECGSCHQAAACNACHTGAVASAIVGGKAQHGVHSSLGKPASSLPVYPAWTGTVGRGVVGVDQTVNSISSETNQCAAVGCHNLEGSAARRPSLIEDYLYGVGGNPEDASGSNTAVSYVGTWRVRYHAIYSGGRANYSGTVGSQLNATFTGTRIEVVSDKDPYRGKAEVWIDGVKQPTAIDCYSATTVSGAVVFSKGGLTATSHTISVRPLNLKNVASRATYVLVDGFNVYSGLPESIAPNCTSCHAAQAEDHGGDFSHEATHTAGAYGGRACTDCHSINLFTEHGRTSSKSDAANCAACHTAYAAYNLNTYDFTCGGTGTTLSGAAQPCHSATQLAHTFTETTLVDASHVDTNASPGPALAECWSCHGKNLVTIHSNSVTSNDPAFVTNCLTCHGTATFPATADCTNAECHSGTGVHSMATHPAPAHLATNNGQTTVPRTGGKSCSTCHALEIANPAGGEHAKASSVTESGAEAIGCVACHAAPYFASIRPWIDTTAPFTTNTCIACHKVASGLPGVTTAGEPHEMADYTSEHNYNAGLNTGCGSGTMTCHSGSTTMLGNIANADTLHAVSKPGNADCTSCHTNNTAVPTQRQCLGCHTSHDTLPAHNSTQALFATNGDCLPCHATFDNLAFGHTACATCHDNDTLTATETRYLQSAFTGECLGCHNATVVGTSAYYTADPNHYNETTHTADIAADTAPTGGTIITGKACTACHSSKLKAEHVLTISAANVNCIDCHTSAMSTTTINADWLPGKKCSNCHGALHNSLGARHDMSSSASTLGCSGASCHDGSNVATLHADRVLSTDAAITSCNVCHASADATVGATGCDSTGCHSGAGHDHGLDTAASAGCYNSGAGCHTELSTDYADHHPDNGCTNGLCHRVAPGGAVNPSKASHPNPNSCQDCHDGTYTNAPDTVPITDSFPVGHYNETTHTAGAVQMGNTYTYNSKSAACSACHNSKLGTEHARSTSAMSGTGTTVCTKCHNDSAAVTGIVTTSWPNKNSVSSCSGCHANTDGTSAATAHANVATHATGTSVTGCTGLGTGCHGTLATPNLTTVHPGCALTRACHSTTVYNPGSKTCTAAACHPAATYNTTTYTHGTVDGTDTAHQVTGASMATTLRFGTGTTTATCGTCHSNALKPAHNYAAGFATASLTWTNECRGCHNATTPINVATLVANNTWTNTCLGGGCHNTTQQAHVDGGTDVPTVMGVNTTTPACTKSGCHVTLELHALHKNASGGCGLSDPNGGCHTAANRDKRPTQKTCGDTGGCHQGIQNIAGHGVSSGGTACDVCHSALTGMVSDTTRYHHVLDDASPYQTPANGSYPTSKTSLSCVSCHVDHNMYSSLPGGTGKAYSIRNSGTVATVAGTDTDAGLCLSCHTVLLDRNTTAQKANIIPETKVWSIDPTWWAASPHNYESPGTFDDGSTFRANCAKCHGSLLGTLSSGKFATHFSSEQRILNALGDAVEPNVNEEQMCFRCHSKASDVLAGTKKPSDLVDWYGTQAMSLSNVSIYSQMTAGANSNGHKTHLYANKHLLSEVDETQTYISANKHVECADCHNHHVVGDARHEWGTTNTVSEAIRGVTGQSFNTAAIATTNWAAETEVNSRMAWKTYSTYEYEICFKCHSGANTNLAAWGGNKTGAVTVPKWTNVARDFSVGNQSRHPVLAALDAYPDTTTYGTSKVYAGQLIDIWAPGDTMYCSDCHGNQNAPLPSDPNNINFTQGPHGSSVAFSLRGPNTDWPINSATGALFTLNDVYNGDMPFCMNCHPNVGANKVHARNTTHKASACVNCHILIPHGGGMSRLIGDGDGAMPARYAYNNDKSTMKTSSFLKRSDPNTYTRQDCRVTATASACSGTGAHTAGSDATKENW